MPQSEAPDESDQVDHVENAEDVATRAHPAGGGGPPHNIADPALTSDGDDHVERLVGAPALKEGVSWQGLC